MNAIDRWREILDVLLRRKLRSALTALSVAWGIFMLVVLLAAGRGLADGVRGAFGRDAVNAVWINPGVVSKAYRGTSVGRRVMLDDVDYGLSTRPAKVGNASAVIGVGERLVVHQPRSGSFQVRGVYPGHQAIEKTTVTQGRFIDPADIDEQRKVAVIGKRVREALFAPDVDPLGGWINIGASVFRVVGVFEDPNEDREEQTVYLPFSTARLSFATGPQIHQIALAMDTQTSKESAPILDDIRRTIGARKGVSPDDKRAINMWNSQEMFERVTGLFAGIEAFVWLVGLGTILAGVVGVSNIMLISVAERTREIGVRKAIGATPSSIVRMIVEEAMVITLVSGYLGLVAAVVLVEGVGQFLPKTPFFATPHVDLGVGLGATGVLMLAGVVAGLFPALRAARIHPIAALRVE